MKSISPCQEKRGKQQFGWTPILPKIFIAFYMLNRVNILIVTLSLTFQLGFTQSEYLDYWDVPDNELAYNPPNASGAPVKNPKLQVVPPPPVVARLVTSIVPKLYCRWKRNWPYS